MVPSNDLTLQHWVSSAYIMIDEVREDHHTIHICMYYKSKSRERDVFLYVLISHVLGGKRHSIKSSSFPHVHL